MPRYLSSVGKGTEDIGSGVLKFGILKEIFLAGSLSKREIVMKLKEKKHSSWVRQLTETENLETLVERVCGELTLNHILAGVSDEQN